MELHLSEGLRIFLSKWQLWVDCCRLMKGVDALTDFAIRQLREINPKRREQQVRLPP